MTAISLFRKINKYALFLVVIVPLVSCTDDPSDLQFNSAPVIVDQEFVLPENSPDGTIVGIISASDINGDPLTYNITSGNDGNVFHLNATSGQIAVAKSRDLDFETVTQFAFVVEVRDDDDGVNSAEITITLTNKYELEFSLSLSDEEKIDAILYFKEIALGFESSEASQIVRKWKEDLVIYMEGTRKDDLMLELDWILENINDLTGDLWKARITDDESESNFTIFFGSGDEFAEFNPGAEDLVASNWGLFSVNWSVDNELISGVMYVDIDRANVLEEQHLLREGLTQSLGLGRDSDKYVSSIFQRDFNTKAVLYSKLDKALIIMLYHPEMEIGLDAGSVDPILKRLVARLF